MLHCKKDTFEEIQICRLLLRVFELGHILVRLVNAENRDEKSVNGKQTENSEWKWRKMYATKNIKMNTILLIKQLFAISHCDILTIKAQKFIVINQMRNFTRTSFCAFYMQQFFSLMMEFSSVSEYIFFSMWSDGKKSETTFVEYSRSKNDCWKNRMYLNQMKLYRYVSA